MSRRCAPSRQKKKKKRPNKRKIYNPRKKEFSAEEKKNK